MEESKEIVIDAVITWVDGNDPVHKAKMSNYLSDKSTGSNTSFRTLFDQVNEIEFCVKSILKYAKFVRNIFIVTDNQTPGFLKDKEKAKENFPNVFIIDHKTIFKGNEQYLPTFNSLSIETLLFKVPNLAEHFIYFNDDFFLINETTPNDFFINGLPVLRGKWMPHNKNIVKNRIFSNKKEKYTVLYRKAKDTSSKILGFDKSFNIHHSPHPIRKSTLVDFFKKNKAILLQNIKFKFRHEDQYILQSLANHIELKNNTCIQEKKLAIVYMKSYTFFKTFKKFTRAKYNKNYLFMCLQNLDQCDAKKLVFIKKWLHKKYN